VQAKLIPIVAKCMSFSLKGRNVLAQKMINISQCVSNRQFVSFTLNRHRNTTQTSNEWNHFDEKHLKLWVFSHCSYTFSVTLTYIVMKVCSISEEEKLPNSINSRPAHGEDQMWLRGRKQHQTSCFHTRVTTIKSLPN